MFDREPERPGFGCLATLRRGKRAAGVSQLPRWAALVDIKYPLSAVALREGGCTRREPIFLSAHSCEYVAR